MVPNSAFRFKPVDLGADLADQKPFGQATVATISTPTLYTLEKKTIVKKEVEKGITDGQNTEILSGLNEGETVITGIIVEKEGK
jgi:HlyD family secretion protein